MLQFAVCDDEPFMLKQIVSGLSRYMKCQGVPFSILRFSSGRSLLEYYEKNGSPDLVIVDIEMEPPDGMETARLLRNQGYEGLLIFITVLKERVLDSFEVEPYDYLVKPVEEQKFVRTMERALKAMKRNTGRNLLIQRGNSCRVVPLSQIMYFEVLSRKIYIHEKNGTIADYYDKLEHVQHQVDNRFFRCHRSYLVNLDHVRGCSGGLVLLANGEEIPLSRLRRQEFTQALLTHMKERHR